MSRKSPSECCEGESIRRAEDLRGEIDELIEELDERLGEENYTIGRDGSINIINKIEITPGTREALKKTETRLKKIYQEVKEIGIDIFKNTSPEIIH